MSDLKGFAPPYTESGRSALVPNPPWFYSGDLLTVEYRTDVDLVKLASELVIDAIVPTVGLRQEVARRFERYEKKHETRPKKKHLVPPM